MNRDTHAGKCGRSVGLEEDARCRLVRAAECDQLACLEANVRMLEDLDPLAELRSAPRTSVLVDDGRRSEFERSQCARGPTDEKRSND